MKTLLTTSLAIIVLAACNNKASLCDCVEKGDKVNLYAHGLLMNTVHTDAQKDSLELLKKERDEICKDFIDIDPLKLEEERANCEGIKIQ